MGFVIDKYHFQTDLLIDKLPIQELRQLQKGMSRLEVKKGGVVFREGTFPKGVYLVQKGKVKIYQTNRDGKQQIVYIYRHGELMGYRPIISGEPNPVSAAALEDTLLTFIPKKHFLRALDTAPLLTKKLMVNLAHEFSVWVNKVSIFAQQPVRERVALSLRILSEKYKKDDQQFPVVIDLSREDLANYVGTSVETLVRMLRQLKDEQIIRSAGRKITVLRPDLLEEIAGSH